MPLQGSPCVELILAKQANVRAGPHVVALHVAVGLALVTQLLGAQVTTPKLGTGRVHMVDCMLFDVSRHFGLLHED
jgi:hypothetical protein